MDARGAWLETGLWLGTLPGCDTLAAVTSGPVCGDLSERKAHLHDHEQARARTEGGRASARNARAPQTGPEVTAARAAMDKSSSLIEAGFESHISHSGVS